LLSSNKSTTDLDSNRLEAESKTDLEKNNNDENLYSDDKGKLFNILNQLIIDLKKEKNVPGPIICKKYCR
jgi:hypothetical protein